MLFRSGAACFEPTRHGAAPSADAGSDAARGRNPRSGDHRTITPTQQKKIAARTRTLLGRRAVQEGPVTIPVYVHVMRDANGVGDVTDAQITQQIAVMNTSYAGGKSSTAAKTGFSFTLAGIDRFNNTQWHQDKQSTTYRAQIGRAHV